MKISTRRLYRLALIPTALSLAAAAHAVITIPSDGSDGAFSPAANVTVDLSQAVTGAWDQNNAANAGKGVYDPAKWAVVFKYSSVNIPAGVTVTFKNHPSFAPVVWLVQGSATIGGIVDLSSPTASQTFSPTTPGPGGFRGGGGGGSLVPGGAGFGPGGGPFGSGDRGNFGNPAVGPPDYGIAYSNAQILPLVGGSGGAGYTSTSGYDASGGGGAILIAAGDTITVSGAVTANSGTTLTGVGGGSGGAIRLIADKVTGSGTLNAYGNSAGAVGRIRVEANTASLGGSGSPTPSISVPNTPTPDIWPPATHPTMKIVSIGGVAAPADPNGAFTVGSQDVTLPNTSPAVVRLQATNMPTNWVVSIRVVPLSGQDLWVNATLVSGDATSSIWEATINPNQRFSAIQGRAHKP